jgi:hypothetical protein
MKRIIIKASEVAAVIGKNPYKKPEEVRDELWKKYAPDTFTGETKTDRAEKALGASLLAQKVLAESVVVHAKSSDEVTQIFEKARVQIQSDASLTQTLKAEVTEHIRSKVYTTHGIRSEDKTSDKVEVDEKIKLIRDDSFYKLNIWENFQIVGRIDRIEEKANGSRVLVEIKNRTRRLFQKVPDYEYIQIQTYLQMLKLDHARHVEQFNSQVNSTEITRDDEFWEREVLPALVEFCKDFSLEITGKVI